MREKSKPKEKNLKPIVVGDFMRGCPEKQITIRFDPEDLVTLPCQTDYDPKLRGDKNNQVVVVRKIEIQNPDGSWGPYPSVTWLDGVQDEEHLVTVAFVKKTGESGFDILSSSQGVPDGTLMIAAKGAEVYTETIN